MGERYVDNEEAFWELVSINAEVTSQPIEERMRNVQNERVNRDVSRIDVESKILIQFDEHGNKTETALTGELAELFSGSRVFVNEEQASARFDTGVRTMYVPFASLPTPEDGRSVFVGGGFFNTNTSHRSVEFWTYNFPSGMRTIDVYITNQWGDDTLRVLDVGPMEEVIHSLRYAGEPYGARVSSYDGSFSNVQLRFFARGQSVAPAPTWTWPVPSSNRITQHFNSPNHLGVDIGPSTAGVEGASIVSFAAGNVILSGWVSGYGEALYINTSNLNGFNWIQHRYGHLQTGSRISNNAQVSMGQQIARLGNTGVSTGPHLHFETRHSSTSPSTANASSTPINPISNFFPSMTYGVDSFIYDINPDESSNFVNEVAVFAASGDLYTLGNLTLLTQEEALLLDITQESLQIAIDYFGVEFVLEQLEGLGLEHIGFTLQEDGVLTANR